MQKHTNRNECERCGTCCIKGGPALHEADARMLRDEIIPRESLITIRKGEPVLYPDQDAIQWNRNELVKLKGRNSQWTCTYFDEQDSSCTIYENRPLECALLKCWDTEDLEKVIGKNCLTRHDIIKDSEPIVDYIRKHESICGLELLKKINIHESQTFTEKTLAIFTEIANVDLQVRAEAVNRFKLTLDTELFYFGRPIFMMLSDFGLETTEVDGRVIITQP